MKDWENISWVQKDWLPYVFGAVLFIALIASIVWFIDGVRKYGYWLKKDNV